MAEPARLSPGTRSLGLDPARIRARRIREKIFIACGLASTLVGLIALSLLLFDLAAEGLPRLSWDFFTSFPSRRASAVGILSAWVGSLLVILVHRSQDRVPPALHREGRENTLAGSAIRVRPHLERAAHPRGDVLGPL